MLLEVRIAIISGEGCYQLGRGMRGFWSEANVLDLEMCDGCIAVYMCKNALNCALKLLKSNVLYFAILQ